MAEVRSQFGEGDEDEAALEHAGVGDLQVRLGDGFQAVEEDVQVEESRTFGDKFVAAEGSFDATEGAEESSSGESGFGVEDAIEEPGLVEEVHGLGFVESGDAEDADARLFEGGEGGAEIGGAVAQVGAEGEVDLVRGHGRTIVAREGGEMLMGGAWGWVDLLMARGTGWMRIRR
jgi:hypothetical protein